MKFTTGKIFVCDGKEWKALQYEESSLGSRGYPGFSCKEIKTGLKDAANGIYWITLSGRFTLLRIIGIFSSQTQLG